MDNLQSLIENIDTPNMSVKAAAKELKANHGEKLSPIRRVLTQRTEYKRALVLVQKLASNFRNLDSIKEHLWAYDIVSNETEAHELAQDLQLKRMMMDFALMETFVESLTKDKVKEIEQWSLKEAIEREPDYIP
jgi:hypothetical protein